MTLDDEPAGATMQEPPRAGTAVQPPTDRVPADQRVFGIDKRTIWPGVVLLIVWALWTQAMPWIDDQINLDNPIVAGDVINLGNGEVTFVPAVGWDLLSGTLLKEGEEGATADPVECSALVRDGVLQREVRELGRDGRGAARPGDRHQREPGRARPQGRAGPHLDHERRRRAGELAYLVGVDQAALIATFVFEPEGGGTKIGVEIEVRGEPDSLKELAEEYAPMIETTTYRPAGQEAN